MLFRRITQPGMHDTVSHTICYKNAPFLIAVYSLMSCALCRCMVELILTFPPIWRRIPIEKSQYWKTSFNPPCPHYLKVSAKRYLWTGQHFCQHTKWVQWRTCRAFYVGLILELWKYLAICLRAINLAKWDIPEKSIQNVAQRRKPNMSVGGGTVIVILQVLPVCQ